MTLLIEDTARNNLASWTCEGVQHGSIDGAVLSPFTTPRTRNKYKQSGRQTADRLRADGLVAHFDAETHALQMPNVGDFRYYNSWPLWGGAVGDLSTPAAIRDHVERVFAVQDELGVPHLGPTILLHSPQSAESQTALRLAETAADLDGNAILSLTGDSAFWASRAPLDAHVGALAQIDAAGWSLTVVRQFTVLPVPAMAEEVHGLCRTARSLSDYADVHVSHGDLTALPAIAAGAKTLGTGWDPRQRVAAYASYETRATGSDGGGWFQQVTLEGILSLLTHGEATVLEQQNAALAARILPGLVPPGPKEAFFHHVEVLDRVIAGLQIGDHRAAYNNLSTLYGAGTADWPAVAADANIASRANAWLSGVSAGLGLYGQTEGF